MLYSSIATAVSGLPPGRTATYVIAASDSTNQEKAQADVVVAADGDLAIIVEAAIASGFKDAFLCVGTFNQKTEMNITTEFHLHGACLANYTTAPENVGRRDVVATGGTRVFLADGSNCNMVSIEADGITIDTICFDGNENNQTSGNIIIKPNTSPHQTIETRIRYCQIINGYNAGIYDDAWRLYVDDCSIMNCKYGIYCATNSMMHPTMVGGHIINCEEGISTTTATSEAQAHWSISGVSLSLNANHGLRYNGYDAMISECVFYRNGGDGIYLSRPTSSTVESSSKVVNCVVEANLGNGIECQSGTILIGNSVKNNVFHGIYVAGKNSSIIGNKITGNSAGSATYYGLKLAGTTYGGNNIVEGNTFTLNNGAGDIFTENKSNVIKNNNLLSTNKIVGVGDLVQIEGNLGYIAPGEIRTIQYALTAGAANTITSKDNPFGQAVAVVNVDIRLTTGDADAPNIDGDINAANNSVSGLSLFNDLPGETAGFYRSTISPGTQTVPQLWASGSGNRYLNIAVTDNDGSQLVGTIIVTVMGI